MPTFNSRSQSQSQTTYLPSNPPLLLLFNRVASLLLPLPPAVLPRTPGAFGVVCAGVHKVTGEVVAVKQIPRRLMTTPRLQAEVDLLRMAGQHKNVVGFRDLFSDKNFYYIVMGETERERARARDRRCRSVACDRAHAHVRSRVWGARLRSCVCGPADAENMCHTGISRRSV